MFKNIKFNDYESAPQTICDILSLCNKSTHKDTLQEYSQLDISKLIEQEFLSENEGYYISDTAKFNDLNNKYKKLTTELYPVIHLRKSILQFDLAWYEFYTFIHLLSGNILSGNIIPPSNSDIIKTEYYVNNFLSTISRIRDILKGSFNEIETGQGGQIQIKPTLIDEYKEYQQKYDDLKAKTIDQPYVQEFADFLRNRMLHGGEMMFTFSTHRIPYNNRSYYVATALCDYEMLESSKKMKKNVANNLYHYYNDFTIENMRFVANGITTWDKFEIDDIEKINSDLQIRKNDKNIDVRSLTKDSMQEFLNDKNLVLFMYNIWKNKKVPSFGQFSFDITQLIRLLYETHIKLYSQIYTWIALKNNHKIKILLEIHKEMFNLGDYCYMDELISFDLKLKGNQ